MTEPVASASSGLSGLGELQSAADVRSGRSSRASGEREHVPVSVSKSQYQRVQIVAPCGLPSRRAAMKGRPYFPVRL